METIIVIAALMLAVSCLLANVMIAYMLWQHLHDKRTAFIQMPEETQEEAEARRLAAEAQAKYEQGFINLMNYGGQPNKGVKGE